MSEDPTPQESMAPDPTVPPAQTEQTIEVTAESVPEPPKAESPKVESPKVESPQVEPKVTQASSPKAAAAAPAQTQDTVSQLSKQAKELWIKVQPILKEKSIQALLVANRFTGHFLDNIWPKLSKQAIAAVPASAKAKVEAQKVKVQPTLDKVQPVWEKAIVPFWQKTVVPNWNKGLGLLRQRLPEPLNKELSNRFMTIVILVLVYWVYSFFSSLGGQPVAQKTTPKPIPTPISQRPMRQVTPQPSPLTAPAIQPSPKPSPIPVASPKPIVKPSPVVVASPSPKPSPVVVASPKPSPIVAASPEPSPVVVPSPKPIPAPEVSPSPVAVASPKPIPEAAPKPSPVPVASPKPVVAPAPAPAPANLAPAIDLSAIQAQLNNTLAESAAGLINSVQTTDANNRLQLKLSDRWYGLSAPDQIQTAQTLLEKAQALKFGRLELRDDSGTLVARSPLVGSNIIILKRETAS